MKKALSFAVALGLVAGLASVATAAELEVHGDARLRGLYSTNTTDADDATQDKNQAMDQRYRLNVDVKINDDVKVNTRIALTNNIYFDGGNGLAHTVDRANMVIKALGGTLTLGRQEASWGNKFLGWGASVDRIKYTTKAGGMTVGGYLQKNDEGDSNGYTNGDGDNDTWGALAIGSAGDTKWGVLLNYNIVDTNAAKASGNDTGYLIDPFFTTKIGPASVMGELVYKGGDTMENIDGDPIYGGFVAASMDLAPVTVKGLVAYYANNEGAGNAARDCDDDFAPTLMIGTCNETAILDFGGTTGYDLGPTDPGYDPIARLAQADDTSYLLAVGVDFKPMDKLKLSAGLAYLMATEYGGANGDEEATLVEVDLAAEYQLAQNATYTIGIGYGMPDAWDAQDDDIIVVGNRVEVKW